MKKVTYSCDHCGKQIDIRTDYINCDIGIIDEFELDLCEKCAQELDRLIKSYVQPYAGLTNNA